MENFEVGQKVHYAPGYGKKENGIIKEIRKVKAEVLIFVVYSCGGDWDNYKDYTAALTDTEDLKPGWQDKEKNVKLVPRGTPFDEPNCFNPAKL